MSNKHLILSLMTSAALTSCLVALAGCDAPDDEYSQDFRSGTNPCERLTPEAIQAVIDQIEDGLAMAQEHVASEPEWYTPHAGWAVDSFTTARDKLVEYQTWLADHQYDLPFVSNTTAAYSLHIIAREAAGTLLQAENFSAVGAVWNASLSAKAAAEVGAQATEMLAVLGTDGMNCYMRSYFP